jgi:membrane-associated protein
MGYFLGRSFPAIGKNIDYAMIAILAFTVIPLAFEGWRHRNRGDDGDDTAASTSNSASARAARSEN